VAKRLKERSSGASHSRFVARQAEGRVEWQSRWRLHATASDEKGPG
jgi:hypothetical protein